MNFMFYPSKNRLLILSVPLQRLIRVLLFDGILREFIIDHDVIIVSPFADDKIFQEEFSTPGLGFLKWEEPKAVPNPTRGFLALSSLLRLQGFWRRYMRQGLDYLAVTSHITFGENGNDTEKTLWRRMLLTGIGLIGVWPKAWRLFDALVGPRIFDFTELRILSKSYDKITLIQSTSWVLQDQMLAWMARSNKWRKVMIPYTTDQVYLNGYLYSDFDVVCVQGPYEKQCAATFHNIPEARIASLGSVWFRHIDEIKQRIQNKQSFELGITQRSRIIYAGTSSLYFPRVSEYLGLESLLKAIETGELAGVEVIYRPLGENLEIRTEIVRKFGNVPNLIVQFAQQACYGLNLYGGGRPTRATGRICYPTP